MSGVNPARRAVRTQRGSKERLGGAVRRPGLRPRGLWFDRGEGMVPFGPGRNTQRLKQMDIDVFPGDGPVQLRTDRVGSGSPFSEQPGHCPPPRCFPLSANDYGKTMTLRWFIRFICPISMPIRAGDSWLGVCRSSAPGKRALITGDSRLSILPVTSRERLLAL